MRKSPMERVPHYSDDGYTSDPGVLHVREVRDNAPSPFTGELLATK